MADKVEQFGHEETTKPVALVDVRADLVREIGMRRRVYPRWVHEGRNGLTREKAVYQIAAMESALRLFDATVSIASAAQGLRDAVLLSGGPAYGVIDKTFSPEEITLLRESFDRPGRVVSMTNEASPILRRIEMLDAALATFDRYKVEPPAATEGSQDAAETASR